MERIYEGTLDPTDPLGEVVVTVDSNLIPLDRSLAVYNHSPTGFAWGYRGAGPSQLALAILLDHLGDKDKALEYHQLFKERVIARFPLEGNWKLTSSEIDHEIAWIERLSPMHHV